MRNAAHTTRCSFEPKLANDVANEPSSIEKGLVRNSAFRQNRLLKILMLKAYITAELGVKLFLEICLDLLFRGFKGACIKMIFYSYFGHIETVSCYHSYI